MSRQEHPPDRRRIRGGLAAIGLGLASLASPAARAQAPAPRPPVVSEPAPAAPQPGIAPVMEPAPATSSAPPATVVVGPDLVPEDHGRPIEPVLDPNTQVVRFQGPAGIMVEVLAPQPLPVSVGDNGGVITTGLQCGVGYRLKIGGIPNRPGAELFPVIEVVGHLHRPAEIDPGKYPIRVVFTEQELWDVVDHNRLITKVIYLEDPEQALPLKLKKDQIPVVEINPTEEPVRVAASLGRVMAIVRLGGRRPSAEELQAGATGDVLLDGIVATSAGRCPFAACDGSPCSLPAGPACPPAQPASRPWAPRDEYLCDGGDFGSRAGLGPEGTLRGVDPRDAVVRFDVGLDRYPDPKVLPTNKVCIYAPRFAEVRVSTGTNEAVEIHGLNLNTLTQKAGQAEKTDKLRKLVQNQSAEQARERQRAQGMKGKVYAGENSKVQGAMGYADITQLKVGSQAQAAVTARKQIIPHVAGDRVKLVGIKTVESPVMAGIVQGTGEAVTSVPPREMTGVETPPRRPGLAVVKRVNATEAEPGDTVTYVIMYRNMGNTPIRGVSIVDSLLPRLEYVSGTAKGPKDSKFAVAENRAGAMELKWDLPDVVPPGGSGYVSFEAVVR